MSCNASSMAQLLTDVVKAVPASTAPQPLYSQLRRLIFASCRRASWRKQRGATY